MPLPRKAKRRSGIPVHCGTRQTRLKARPVPDFTKLHNQWSDQCKQRKALKKPCTQIQEFNFSNPGQRKERKREEPTRPRTITRHVASLTRLQPSPQGHLQESRHPDQSQGSRSDPSSSQPDEEFIAEKESLQSILSNTGIATATTVTANERQTLAVAPTFKTPFTVNEPRRSVYYTGPRRDKRLSKTFSDYRKQAVSRLILETAVPSRASVSSPLLRGPIAVQQRQSIYKTYIYPEPLGGTGTSAARSQDLSRTLPRARRVPVPSASSPALRELSKSSTKKKVRWNDLARQSRLTPNSKRDTMVTKLTFNDDLVTFDSDTAQCNGQEVVDHKKEGPSDINQNKNDHRSAEARADVVHQVEPVVESHNRKDLSVPRNTQCRLQPGSPGGGRRNRPIPKHYFPNVLADVSNSPEGRLSPGGIAGKLGSLPIEYLGAIKHEFVVLDDSGSKIYHARSVPETASDKENVSPYLSTFQGHPPVCSDLEQDLSESIVEFDRLEGQVRKLRRQSEAVVAGDDNTTKRNIMEQLAMIKEKQEELIRLQAALQSQLSKQVRESGSTTSVGSPALTGGPVPMGSKERLLHCQREGEVSPDPHQRACPEDSGQTCAGGTAHITELMRTIQLQSLTEDLVPSCGSLPEIRTDIPRVPQSPVLIVTDNDNDSEVVTPPTIQQMALLGIPVVTQGFGKSLLPFPQSPLRNSHYSPFLTRFSGSDGSVLYTPSTPGSQQRVDYYDQAVFSPKSCMAGSAQILSPIKESFPIQLPLTMFTPSPVKHGRKVAPTFDRMQPVANLSRRLHDRMDDFENTPSPKVKQHSPLPRVVIPAVGALSLAGNLAPHRRRNTRHQGTMASIRDKILGSAAHRYCEALLDEEVALFACRLHVTLGLAPLLISRCSDPVATVLDQGDDQHFVPICDSPSRSPPFSSAFSVFSHITH